MARGLVAGAAGLAATLAVVVAGAPQADALSLTCELATTVDDEAFIQLGGSDAERTRSVLGYQPSKERVFVRMRDAANPSAEIDNSCQQAGGWDRVSAEFGALDDRLRLDGKGLPGRFANPLSASIQAFAFGGGGDDVLRGHAGFDRFNAGAGEDLILTGAGHDFALALDDSAGQNDTIEMGAGADEVLADDDVRDDIHCGSGYDYVDANASDRLTACEVVE